MINGLRASVRHRLPCDRDGLRNVCLLPAPDEYERDPCCSPPITNPDDVLQRVSLEDDPATGSNTTTFVAAALGTARIASGIRCDPGLSCAAIGYFNVTIDVVPTSAEPIVAQPRLTG